MTDRDIFKSSLAVTPECLTPEQLEALLDGKQSHPHLASCPRCQSELAMLKSFESDLPLPDEGAAVAWISAHLGRQPDAIKNPAPARTVRPGVRNPERQGSWLVRVFDTGGWHWAVPATAVVAATIMAVILLRPTKEPDLQANAGNPSVVYRSQEVRVVSPVGDVQEAPRNLQWQAFPGTGIYGVAVMEIDKSLLWSTETKGTSIEIPASLRAKMLPGKPILWQVTAVDTNGRVLGTSQVQRFASPREGSSGNAKQPH